MLSFMFLLLLKFYPEEQNISNVNFWNKNQKVLQIYLNSDLKKTWLEEQTLVQHSWIHLNLLKYD